MCVEIAKLSVWEELDKNLSYFIRIEDKNKYEATLICKDECFNSVSTEKLNGLRNIIQERSDYLLVASDFNNLCERIAACTGAKSIDDIVLAMAAQFAYHYKMDLYVDWNGCYLRQSLLMKDLFECSINLKEYLSEHLPNFNKLEPSAQILSILINVKAICKAVGIGN
jgi:hypothetical protein